MGERTFSIERREFTCGAIAAVLVAAMAGARAETGLPHLSETDSAAAALGYKNDASQVDSAKFPQHKAGQHCALCRYFLDTSAKDWGPCAIFPSNAVNANGWCSAFGAR